MQCESYHAIKGKDDKFTHKHTNVKGGDGLTRAQQGSWVTTGTWMARNKDERMKIDHYVRASKAAIGGRPADGDANGKTKIWWNRQRRTDSRTTEKRALKARKASWLDARTRTRAEYHRNRSTSE